MSARDDCPRCGSAERYALRYRPRFKCKACGLQYASTPPEWRSTKLSPEKRAGIAALFASGHNALQVSKVAGVQYRTAWQAGKRLKAASDV